MASRLYYLKDLKTEMYLMNTLNGKWKLTANSENRWKTPTEELVKIRKKEQDLLLQVDLTIEYI